MKAPALVLLLLAPLLAGCVQNLFVLPDVRPPTDPIAHHLHVALEEVADGFERPLLVTHAGDERLFVVEQGGTIRILDDGAVRAQPFLNITDRVGACHFEQGLLGLAFPIDHPQSGRFYVTYTTTPCDRATPQRVGDVVLARYTVHPDDPDQADADSEQVLLRIPQPYRNHNGGHIAFGPDGMLYQGVGDGGHHGDPKKNGQDPRTLLGTILRLDVSGEEYTIPPDNPFVDKRGRDEVWSYGLRNPWRFSFDPATGDLWIGDVGQNQVEEVDMERAGEGGGQNYGWSTWEGSRRHRIPDPNGPVVHPVYEYRHQVGDDVHCSVTGGHVYQGRAIPQLDDDYLFADFCSGHLWRLRPYDGAWDADLVMETGLMVNSFGLDADGEVYLVHYGGSISKLVPSAAHDDHDHGTDGLDLLGDDQPDGNEPTEGNATT